MCADPIYDQRKQNEQQTATEFSDSGLIACQLIGYFGLIT
jgi:hypothetical protein